MIGWAIDDYLHTDLVQAALTMAVAMHGKLAGQVIPPADQGRQYTAAQRPRFAREQKKTTKCFASPPAGGPGSVDLHRRCQGPPRA